MVSATATTTTATIVWNASSRGTYVTSGYQTSWRLADGTWADPTDGAVNVLTHTVRNLTPNRSYQLRVRAYSAHDGTRYYSGWTSATVSTGASQAPSVPTDVEATGGVTQVTLTWEPPTSPGSNPLTGYKVSLQTGSTWPEIPLDDTTRSYTWTGLDHDTTYSVRVRAIASTLQSGWVTRSTITDAGDASAGPRGVVATGGLRSLAVDWEPPAHLGDHSFLRYDIQWSKDGGAWSTQTHTTTTSTSFGSLSAGTYRAQVRVVTVTDGGTELISHWVVSNETEVISSAARLVRPTNVFLSPGEESATLTWDYVLTETVDFGVRLQSRGGTWTSTHWILNEDIRTYTFTGLNAGTEYRAGLQVRNQYNATSPWVQSNFVTVLPPYRVTTHTPPALDRNPADPTTQPLSVTLSLNATLERHDGEFVEDLTPHLLRDRCVIERENCSVVHSTATIAVTKELDWTSVRLRMSLSAMYEQGVETWPLGVYLLETPTYQTGSTPPIWQVDCYGLLTILDTPVGATWTAEGTIAGAIEELVSAANPTLESQLGSVPGDLPSVRTWPIDESTTWLTILNELLSIASWRPAWITRTGELTSAPWYTLPDSLPVVRLTPNEAETILADPASHRVDLWGVPNRWVVYADRANEDLPLPTIGDGIVVRDNLYDGPASQASRSRVVTRVVQSDAVDQAALDSKAEQIQEEDSEPQRSLALTIAPGGWLWHRDTIEVTLPSINLTNQQFLVRSWSLPMDGGYMTVHADGIR